MQLKLSFQKEPLKLPKRYEVLELELKKIGGEVSKIIKKIDDATAHFESLLGKISVSGLGQFQIFLGKSGSGKTTFLKTLPIFYSNIKVIPYSKGHTLSDLPNEIEKHEYQDKHKIFLIDDRDNPIIEDNELKLFFERLRILFRKENGRVLVIWPITDPISAKHIGDLAWSIGSDSLVPTNGAIYHFTGLNKKDYYEVADTTTRSLNKGEGLESFGIPHDDSSSIFIESETIGAFYSRIEDLAFQINEGTWKLLEKKDKPKIWVILGGDTVSELDRTVKALTQGTDNRIDIDRMVSYLDDTGNTSAYLNDWRSRRSDAGYLFRFLDVRLFYVTPNLILSAVRHFGSSEIKNKLKKKTELNSVCMQQIIRSEFYSAITGKTNPSRKTPREAHIDTINEYLRMQFDAKSKDKEINKALAKAVEQCLKDEGYRDFSIIAEKQDLLGTNLKPDLQIRIHSDHVLCIEPTWRTTGKSIDNESETRQNTLSPGHIQKYILEKVMEYVKELNI